MQYTQDMSKHAKRKLNKRIRKLSSIVPGATFKDSFNGQYTVQAVYSGTVHFWWEGFGMCGKTYRNFFTATEDKFLELINPNLLFK